MKILPELERLASDYGLSKLSKHSGVSRAQLNKIFRGKSSPSLQTLEKILIILGRSLCLSEKIDRDLKLRNIEELKYAMASYGAPLVILEESRKLFEGFRIPDFDKVLIRALEEGRNSAEINAILPTFINYNSDKFDIDKIKDIFKDKQYLGYMLDLLYNLTQESRYIIAISHLNLKYSDLRTKKLIKGNPQNKYQKAFLNKSLNNVAKNWKLLTADSFENIKQRFYKWQSFDLH